jgi:hypothetical protein
MLQILVKIYKSSIKIIVAEPEPLHFSAATVAKAMQLQIRFYPSQTHVKMMRLRSVKNPDVVGYGFLRIRL